MQEVNRYRIESIREFFRYSLIGLLLINILSPFVILFINPEGFFLGQKITGTPALVYAMGFFLITALVMISLYKKSKGYAFVALVYGIIFYINGYLNVLNNNGQIPPAIFWLILVCSLILSGVTLLNPSGKQEISREISTSTIFTEKSLAGLFVVAGVFLCFILYMSISLMMYQYETNDCAYRIEIDPDTPLHNVTLMIPYPFRISENIATIGTLIGNSPPCFTNYSQSVVETENGPMIRITADSMGKDQNSSPQIPLSLYQNFFVQGPLTSSDSPDHRSVLSPKSTSEPVSCSDTQFQKMSSGQKSSDCSRYESRMYAAFETDPASQTSITVSFDRMRMISSSQSPRRDAFQERITATISGNAKGWYNASGSLLASAK